MTCSKPINYKQLIDTTCNTTELTHFVHTNNVLFTFEKPCDRCCNGHLNLRKDVSLKWNTTTSLRQLRTTFSADRHHSVIRHSTVKRVCFCLMLILEILTLNLIFLLTTPATRICLTSSGNTIKLKLITRNMLMYNKHD